MKAPNIEARPRRSPFLRLVRNHWVTISFTVVVLCLVAMGVGRMIERKWVGRVCFQIYHDSKDEIDRWVENELKLITSDQTMLSVVRKLKLTRTWKLNEDEGAAIIRLSGMVEVSKAYDGQFIAIEVYNPEAKESIMLANAVAAAFEDLHNVNVIELRQEREQQELFTLAEQIDDLRKQVDSKRSEMLRIKEEYRIADFSDVDGASATGSQNSCELTCKEARQHEAEYKSEVQRLELQLNTLLSVSDLDALLAQAASMRPYAVNMNGAISALYDLKRILASLEDGRLREAPSKINAAQRQVKTCSEILATSLEDFKSSLRTKIQIAKDSFRLIEANFNKDEDGLMADKTKYAEYLSARTDYKEQSTLLKQKYEDFFMRYVDRGLEGPWDPIVCVENAVEAQKAASPNKPMLLAVVTSNGLVLGIALAYLRKSRKARPLPNNCSNRI